jgi:hypothetical protein
MVWEVKRGMRLVLQKFAPFLGRAIRNFLAGLA